MALRDHKADVWVGILISVVAIAVGVFLPAEAFGYLAGLTALVVGIRLCKPEWFLREELGPSVRAYSDLSAIHPSVRELDEYRTKRVIRARRLSYLCAVVLIGILTPIAVYTHNRIKTAFTAYSAVVPAPPLPPPASNLNHPGMRQARHKESPIPVPVTSQPSSEKELSAGQISEIASGMVMAITKSERHIASAFYVDTEAHIATCASVVASPTAPVGVSIATPPMKMGKMEIAGGITRLSASPVTRSEDGVSLLKVALAIFEGPAAAQVRRGHNLPSGGVAYVGRTWIAELSPSLPVVKEKLFVYGLEPTEIPSFSLLEGEIIRLGTSSKGSGIRAFTTVRWRESYCGSPVLNVSGKVIGLLSGITSDGDTELIPSTAILNLMEQRRMAK